MAKAYREQKRLAAFTGKMRGCGIFTHRQEERCIVFTDDNATAYRIGSSFPITGTHPPHQKR